MSLSLDFTEFLANASVIINGLFPVFAWPVGISLGMGLLTWIVSAISSAVKKR
jgi:hypothetical protein